MIEYVEFPNRVLRIETTRSDDNLVWTVDVESGPPLTEIERSRVTYEMLAEFDTRGIVPVVTTAEHGVVKALKGLQE